MLVNCLYTTKDLKYYLETKNQVCETLQKKYDTEEDETKKYVVNH